MNAIERRKCDLEQYTPELTIGLEQVNTSGNLLCKPARTSRFRCSSRL